MTSCGNGVIQWCLFDWQAFSTLATGFAAVAGAVFVGKRQVDISRQQANILARQVELEEAKIRAELFQRRLDTFDATVDFLIHITALPEDDLLADERVTRFGIKMRESQFLFANPNVHPRLQGYWEKGNEARADKAIIRAEHKDKLPISSDRMKRLLEYPVWGLQEVATLADLFRADLTILKTD